MRAYPILSRLLAPLLLLWMRWRARVEPAWAEGLQERRGEINAPAGALWIHAASVGEVISARSLVAQLREQLPQQALLLTAFTPTGVARWREQHPGVSVAHLPIDHPVWMRRAVQQLQPRAVLIVETEIWPNHLLALHQQQVPVAFVSARIRERSVRGWQRWLGAALLREIMGPVRLVGAQTPPDAERFKALGASKVAVQGSLKWDARPPAPGADFQADFSRALGDRPLWLAASTHAGEEEMILDVHTALRKEFPDLCLLLAPRHPRRAAEVRALCEARGLALAQRSAAEFPRAEHAVWLLDTLGELTDFMHCAPLVFMGGSLVPIGGHNLLEPAAAGCAIATGPHMQSCQDVVDALLQAGGLTQVPDPAALTRCLRDWLGAPEVAREQAGRAAALIEAGGGATQAALQTCAGLLAESRS